MNTWKLTINGNETQVDLVKGTEKNEYVICVNGEECLRETLRPDIFNVVDLTFEADGKELHIVKVKDEFDLAVDGEFVNHRIKYEKLKLPLMGAALAVIAAYGIVIGIMISVIQSNLIGLYVFFPLLFLSIPCIIFPIIRINVSPFATNKTKFKRSLLFVIIPWLVFIVLFFIIF